MQAIAVRGALPALLLLVGCTPDIWSTLIAADPIGNIVQGAGITPINGAASGTNRLQGRVATAGDYRLFELAPGAPGDEIVIDAVPIGLTVRAFTVALFDADLNLLKRGVVQSNTRLRHILREDADALFVGITPASRSGGGDFDFAVQRLRGRGVPGAAPQRVYLNFAGGSDIRVSTRAPISFPPFHAEVLGAQYAADTEAIKDLIVSQLRSDYATFGVDVYASDEGPPPALPYSVLHFGSEDPGLLGLADNVDQYNENPNQTAMVYVGSFGIFDYLGLSVEEMGMMVANTASHELGHLLGLFHTKNPADVMDTTANAWELTENQAFVRADLEPTVFPIGYGDSPRLLEQVVGVRKVAGDTLKVTRDPQKILRRAAVNRLISEELGCACGTCLALDE